jgi:hypothetical protein
MTAEHLCIVCPQLRQGEPRVYERAQVCEGCRPRLRSMLAEAVEHFAHVDPRKGSTKGERVSGSRTPPLPLLVDPLDLRMPPHLDTVHDPFGDQTGEISAATVLESWARDWQTYWWATLPPPTVGRLAHWLGLRLDMACDQHPAIDEFATGLRDLIRALRRVNGHLGPAFDLLDVPCRRCDWLTLVPVARADRVECLHCGDLASGEEYHRWTGLLVAGVRDQWVDFDLDALLYVDEAALLVRVSQNTVRLWVGRGVLAVAVRDHGRPRFAARDVFEAERRTRTGLLAV